MAGGVGVLARSGVEENAVLGEAVGVFVRVAEVKREVVAGDQAPDLLAVRQGQRHGSSSKYGTG